MDRVENYVEQLREPRKGIIAFVLLLIVWLGVLVWGCTMIDAVIGSVLPSSSFDSEAYLIELGHLPVYALAGSFYLMFMTFMSCLVGATTVEVVSRFIGKNQDALVLNLWDRVKELEARVEVKS